MRSKEKLIRHALQDIRENILLAQSFVAGLGVENFARNREKVYAVVRCLEIVSEASRRLPEEIRSRHTRIAWPDIAGAGNIYRHEYERLEDLEIWNTVQIDLPPLLAAVEEELNRMPAP